MWESIPHFEERFTDSAGDNDAKKKARDDRAGFE